MGSVVEKASARSLVYHNGALGDFLTALPAMAAWRRLRGGRPLALLGKPHFAELAADGLFEEAWDAGSAMFASLFRGGDEPVPAGLAELFSSIDAALLFASAASALPGAFSRLGVARIVRQDPFPHEAMAKIDYHLSLFGDPLAFEPEERTPRIALGPCPLPVSRRIAVLHPGSGSPEKNWPLARFAALADLLGARGFEVRWIAGPAEHDTAFPAGAVVWRGVQLRELASALSACGVYVGNDSGVTHLAAAAGCPVVALFGRTDERIWAPRGARVRVVRAPQGDLERLAVEAVFREAVLFSE